MKKEEFVRNQLAKIPETVFDGEEATILCPFHDDQNPSLRVMLGRKVNRKGHTITAGGFFCWSCKSGGNWNALAEKLNQTRKLNLLLWDAKEAANTPDDLFGAMKRDVDDLMRHKDFIYRKPATDGPWEEPWRELSGQFLRDHGAETLWDYKDEAYRIMLPVQDVQGQQVGHVGARPDGSTIPDKRKYVNSVNFPSDRVWYCLNREIMKPIVVIVEGPYDTLRFRHHGIPAIGCFGVSTLFDSKIYQLLSAGIRKVVLCLDGDDAGRAAVGLFNIELKKMGIEVVDMDLTQYRESEGQKIDPGNCPEQAMSDLKRYLGIT